jgi:translocation and assembly module TamB
MTLDGSLQLTGANQPYLLRGTLSILDGLYAKELSSDNTSISNASTQEATLLLDIKTEMMNNFQIKNSLISAQSSGSLLIGGTNLAPVFQGSLNIEKGYLYARDQTFTISRGTANFQKSIRPAVTLQANTAIRYNNSDYKIDLYANGQASDLKLDFKSEPPLSTQDIVSLLTFGFIRSDIEKNEFNNSANTEGGGLIQSAGLEAFQAIFGKKIGSNLNKTTGFQVSLGTKLDHSQQEAITKVEVMRKLGKKTTATFGRSLNVNKPENNFQVDYKLFKNMNLTGVWESPEPEEQSMGADIRFKFDLK